MTDFLTSLVARSLGTETTIRPRVASLFEPTRHGEVTLREGPAAESAEAAIANEVEVSPDSGRKMSSSTPAMREGRRLRDGKYWEDERPVAATVPQVRAGSEPRTMTVPAYETREKENKVIAARARPGKTPLAEKGPVNEPEPVLRSDSESGMAKRRPARAPDISAIRNEIDDKGHRGLLLPPKASTALMAEMKATASALNGGLGAPKREKAGIASPARDAEPEPIVHVTIGRIEVRAASESKPVGRPRAASPVMSLEEYLHRRDPRGGQ
jgi:hypothetical protein